MAADDWKQETSLGFPGQLDADFARGILRWGGPVVRALLHPVLEGVENLPAQKPYLIVSNHSGLGDAELVGLFVAFLERFGTSLAIAGMVHPLSFRGKRKLMEKVGAIPSTYPAAEAALRSGVPVLVFPGGDYEAMRPIWQAYKVDFGGRKGFLRIAQKTGVPLVPMGIRGSHYVAPVLWRSDKWLSRMLVLPALMGIKRFPVTLLGVLGLTALAWAGARSHWPSLATLALAWLWLVSPLSRLPWIPVTMRVRIGQPIEAAALFDSIGDAGLDQAYGRVTSTIQSLVSAGHVTPD